MSKKKNPLPRKFAGLPPMVNLEKAWNEMYRALGPIEYPEPRSKGVDLQFFHSPVRQESNAHYEQLKRTARKLQTVIDEELNRPNDPGAILKFYYLADKWAEKNERPDVGSFFKKEATRAIDEEEISRLRIRAKKIQNELNEISSHCWIALIDGQKLIADPVTSDELDRRKIIRDKLYESFDEIMPYTLSESERGTPFPIERQEWSWLALEGIIERNVHNVFIIDTNHVKFSEHPGRWKVYLNADGVQSMLKKFEQEIKKSRPRNWGGHPTEYSGKCYDLIRTLELKDKGKDHPERIQWLVASGYFQKTTDGKYICSRFSGLNGYKPIAFGTLRRYISEILNEE